VSNLRLREADFADAESISLLMIPVVKEYVINEYSEQGKKIILQSMSVENIQSNLKSHYRYFLAENEGDDGVEVVGILGIKNEDHIFHCFVHRDFHRKKIANKLWIYWLQQNSPKQVSVNSSRYAINFYQSLGFEASGECFEKNGVVCYPMVFLR